VSAAGPANDQNGTRVSLAAVMAMTTVEILVLRRWTKRRCGGAAGAEPAVRRGVLIRWMAMFIGCFSLRCGRRNSAATAMLVSGRSARDRAGRPPTGG
jgi:hypothetical protein